MFTFVNVEIDNLSRQRQALFLFSWIHVSSADSKFNRISSNTPKPENDKLLTKLSWQPITYSVERKFKRPYFSKVFFDLLINGQLLS